MITAPNGEPAQMKFLREQMGEAAKDPVKFAEFMAKVGQMQPPPGAPSPEQMEEQRRKIEEAQRKNLEDQIWRTTYLERVKVFAGDKNAPADATEQFQVAGKIADTAVAVMRDAGRL